MKRESPGFHSLAAKAHLGARQDGRPLSTPIVRSTNFEVKTSQELGRRYFARDEKVYTRFGNPTQNAAADKLAQLEGAESALVFSSGMAAISSSLFTVLKPGDHVVSQREIFAQTFTVLDRMARSFGIETDFIDATDPDNVRAALRPETRLIYIETPSNPLLKIIDIEAVGAIAREKGLHLFVDGTFASPYLQNPLALGATLVLHSGTKYLGGHSDVLCGVAAGDTSLIQEIREIQIHLGGVLDPQAAWLLLRGMGTLAVRLQRQCDNALELAQFLEEHEEIARVHYPLLDSSPYLELASRQMRGGGGVLSFEVRGGIEPARAFVNALEFIPIATSLGGIETTTEIPYELDFNEEELGEAAAHTGIDPGLVRLAAGIEDVDDLKKDLRRALTAAGKHQRASGGALEE